MNYLDNSQQKKIPVFFQKLLPKTPTLKLQRKYLKQLFSKDPQLNIGIRKTFVTIEMYIIHKIRASTVKENLKKIKVDDNLGIVLSDGCRLSARTWMPENAYDSPVPVILEYLPYRKRDGTIARDELTHPYFAKNGYASVRVDIRGNGDSQGTMVDEYTPQELSDAVEVINWLAKQPWCSGTVGMMGISWGGFNALQVAALQPKPLKA